MKLSATPIAGMFLIDTPRHQDARGSLERLLCAASLAPLAPERSWLQANLTHTAQRGTVRGLHLQRAPAAEAKLIRCIRGQAFDVTVDLRPGSPTQGQWHGVLLNDTQPRSVLIPEGCAHGVQALSHTMTLVYHHSAPYQPAYETGVQPDDPDLAIAWPLPLSLVSERDRALPRLTDFLRSLA